MGAAIFSTLTLLNALLGKHSPALDLATGIPVGLFFYLVSLSLTKAISPVEINTIEEVIGHYPAVKPFLKIITGI